MAENMKTLGKKRKRNTEENNKPSKKVAVQIPSPVKSVKISVVPGTQESAPIVVITPGVVVPDWVVLQTYARPRKNAPIEPGESGIIATNELLIQSSDHPSIDYLGREEEAGGIDSLLKHYVGAYDPKTGKLQIMEARKMVLRGTVRSQVAAPETMAERQILTNAQLRNDLGQNFGTKKARKAIASLTENAISSNRAARQPSPGGTQQTKLDSVAAVMLESMAEAAGSIATRDQMAAAVNDAKPRPKANLTAENVQDVYTIEALIGKEILKLVPVKEWQDAVKAKKEIITKSKYVAHRLQRTTLANDVQKLRVLRYLLSVLEFFGSTRPKGKTVRVLPHKDALRAAVPGIPEAVFENIRRKFSVNGQMLRYETDLLITHVCALALIVDNFEVDMYDLREDLHLEVKEISQYFHEIGARVVAAGEEQRKKLGLDKAAAAQHKFAKLKLPLDFPKAKFSRRK